MDPITVEKLQAMKNYKKTHFLQSLIQYSLTAFVLGLYASKGFSFLSSSMTLFFSVSLPNIGAFLVGPKCLFILCNMIVIFLVGESKLTGSSSSSTASDMYDEYVKESRGLRRLTPIEGGKEREMKLEVPLIEENVEVIKEAVVEDKEEKEGGEEQEEEEDKPKSIKKGIENFDGGEEELGLPDDELKKKVEDFIAKVNKQRWVEAKMLVCCG